MDLRHKLTYLQATFAVFALVSASATYYGVHHYLQVSAQHWQDAVDKMSLVEQFRIDIQSQMIAMYELADGRRPFDSFYKAQRDALLSQLDEITRFGVDLIGEVNQEIFRTLSTKLRTELSRVEELVRNNEMSQAKAIIGTNIGMDLLESLDSRLQDVRRKLNRSRRLTMTQLLDSTARFEWLTYAVAIASVGLLLIGTNLIHRWLLTPITSLQRATNEFAQGNLDYRVTLPTGDELAALGMAMNNMAVSLGESNRKYRALFENQQDAMIICDAAGLVLECHDGETLILGERATTATGRRLWEVWPNLENAGWDWFDVVSRVAATGGRYTTTDRTLQDENEKETIVDIIAYPVVYADSRYAAIVIRDVTNRHRLQRMQSRSDTMEAAVTLARGIAHDFKNLLHSAVMSLSLIDAKHPHEKDATRVGTALKACEQAAGLSRRLLNFASSDEGHPEQLELSETVDLILGSLDEVFLASIKVEKNFQGENNIRIDRDQLTQVVLNLIRNACEAMPDGGQLRIETKLKTATNPYTHAQSASYSVLTIADQGCGMSEKVQERIFEPLYSTKTRAEGAVRGMGLAVVYAAVRNAGGFILLDSKIGQGTTFEVYLPSANI